VLFGFEHTLLTNNLDAFALVEAPITQDQFTVVHLNQNTFEYRKLGEGNVEVALNWLGIGFQATVIGQTKNAIG